MGYFSATLRFTRQQPIYAHSTMFLDADKDVRWRGKKPTLIFRKLTLANAKLTSEFVLRDVESSQLPDSSPEGLHIGHGHFFALLPA